MKALTDYDLELMAALWKLLDEPVAANGPDHRTFFRIEDGQTGLPGDGLIHYCELLDEKVLHYKPSAIFVTGMEFLCGSTTLLLKAPLQRPRAFQVALQQKITPFPRLHGNTADSPSMISGHCLEGCLGGAWIAWRLRQWVPGLDWSRVIPAIQKWSVDMGDRRVYACVHYPSDNVGSWWVALSLLQTLVDHQMPEAPWLMEFVRESIRQSSVYKLMQATNPPCALWPLLEQKVGTGFP